MTRLAFAAVLAALAAPAHAQVGRLPADLEQALHFPPDPGAPDSTGWLLNGADIFFTGGNVGVGIGVPAFPFHVVNGSDRAVVGQSTASTGIAYGGVFTSAVTYRSLTSGGFTNVQDTMGAFSITANAVSAIPEPSTYAVVLGALVLGFVALRRRKA